MKNTLGVEITKPEQILILLRGLPGSGKSTTAKSIVGSGIIHSTDDIIESMGDYNNFFKIIKETNDVSKLHQAHSTNLKNAKQSMLSGISPIVIDNTNIKANEPKAYVLEALKMGYDHNNIKIIDIGTGGLNVLELANRNTHGVPLEKIESMIQSYTSVGPLTVGKILESKDMFNKTNVAYSAVVLTEESRNKLLDILSPIIPNGWKVIADHMTIKLGELKDKSDIGVIVALEVVALGYSDTNVAVKVLGCSSSNKIPHITLAVNLEGGGKPKDSNEITTWVPMESFTVEGIVKEISNKVNFLNNIVDGKSEFLKESNERIKNRAWIKISQEIAIKVLQRLDELNWDKNKLSEIMDITIDEVNKIVRGKENLTLEILTKLQSALQIKLINV